MTHKNRCQECKKDMDDLCKWCVKKLHAKWKSDNCDHHAAENCDCHKDLDPFVGDKDGT